MSSLAIAHRLVTENAQEATVAFTLQPFESRVRQIFGEKLRQHIRP